MSGLIIRAGCLLPTAFPPPTKCTISTWSFSSSTVADHAARRTTFLLSSIAMRSGVRLSRVTKSCSERPSTTSHSSPFMRRFKRFPCLGSGGKYNAPQFGLAASCQCLDQNCRAARGERRSLRPYYSHAVVLCLHWIDHRNQDHPAQISNQVAFRKASLQLNTGVFAGSIGIFCALFRQIRLLDTLNHFDYDSLVQ